MSDEIAKVMQAILPHARRAETGLSTLPAFRAISGKRPGSVQFVEDKRPNWWQFPRETRTNPDLKFLIELIGDRLGRVEPYRSVIGNRISFPELDDSSQYQRGVDLAYQLLTTYLLVAGAGRWQDAVFREVWKDFARYCDPRTTTIEYMLYAPVTGLSGITRSLRLGDRLHLRRLNPEDMARLASSDQELAGVTFDHKLTLWTPMFLVRTVVLKKVVHSDDDPSWRLQTFEDMLMPRLVAEINEEVTLLRALLSEEVSLGACVLLPQQYLRSPYRHRLELPWRVSARMVTNELQPSQVRTYHRLRASFLEMEGGKHWARVMASMRRFAGAWDNRFRADILADVVAALERLLVGNDSTEISYKLRVRTAHLLARTSDDRSRISKDVSEAYQMRSAIFHGGYISDSYSELPLKGRTTAAKGAKGNPFHHANEVGRLTSIIAGYYRRALTLLIRRGADFDWQGMAL